MSFFFTQKKKDEKEVCQRAGGSQRQALLTFRQTALAEVAARDGLPEVSFSHARTLGAREVR